MACDTKVCDKCGIVNHWRRFRIRLGNGMMRESDTCSNCRAKEIRARSANECAKKKRAQKIVSTNIATHQKKLELGYPYYYPEIEKMMRSYCNRKTAMDRKYLRDMADYKPNANLRIRKQQEEAIKHAKGWIGFYDEILEHALNLLRQTGQRPSWAALEKSGDLQRLYGVANTRRASHLRGW